MADTILELMTRVNIEPLKAAMADASGSVAATTAGMKASFAAVGAGVDVAAAHVKSVGTAFEQVSPAAVKMATSGIFAFEEIKKRVIESTREVGALRQEILQTNDAAKLAQLNAQLDQARARMTAARTEMRGMRLEMNETREKADMLGETMGVKIPGALGRMLGQLPALQAAMDAAFAPIVVLFFADALKRVIESIDEAGAHLAGYTEEVKAAEAEAKKANEDQIRHAGSITDAHQKISESLRGLGAVAQETYLDKLQKSSEKARRETSFLADAMTLGGVSSYRTWANAASDAANAQVKLTDRLQEQLRGLNEVTAATGKLTLKALEGEEAANKVGKSRADQLREEIELLDKKQHLEEQIALKEAASKKGADEGDLTRARQGVTDDFAAKRLELTRQLALEEKQTTIAAAQAQNEARRALVNSYLSFYESGLKQLFVAGQITLAEEIAGEKAANEQRLANDREYFAKRREYLERERATGKDVTPQVTATNTEEERNALQSAEKMREINARSAAETLRQENGLALARIEAQKTVADAASRMVEESAKGRLAAGKLSLEEETAILKAEEIKRIESSRAVLQEQLRQAKQFPEQQARTTTDLNGRLIALESEKTARLEAIDAEYTRKSLEEQRRLMEETLRFVDETSSRQLTAVTAADARRLQSHQITLAEWGSSERAAVEKWAAEQSAAINTAMAKARTLYGQDSIEYKKLIDKKIELDQQRETRLAAIDDKIASKQMAYINRVTEQMNRSIISWIDGQEKFGAAMQHVWESIANNAIENILKVAEQMIVAEITHKAVAKEGVLTDAKSAAASAFKWVMQEVPFPANAILAPVAAAGAFAGVMAFSAFEHGGIVPETQMALVHKNEMVLPAHIARMFTSPTASLSHLAAAVHGSGSPSSGAAVSRSETHHHYHTNTEFNLHHNGKDARQVLEDELVPRIKQAMRRGQLPSG